MTEYIAKCSEVVGIGGRTLIAPDYIDTSREVVRCEDCKYMSRDSDVFKWCYRLSPEFACEPNGFCAWGIRREP